MGAWEGQLLAAGEGALGDLDSSRVAGVMLGRRWAANFGAGKCRAVQFSCNTGGKDQSGVAGAPGPPRELTSKQA